MKPYQYEGKVLISELNDLLGLHMNDSDVDTIVEHDVEKLKQLYTLLLSFRGF